MRGKGENLGGVLMQHCNVLDEYCNGSLSLGITCMIGRRGEREEEGERGRERVERREGERGKGREGGRGSKES